MYNANQRIYIDFDNIFLFIILLPGLILNLLVEKDDGGVLIKSATA